MNTVQLIAILAAVFFLLQVLWLTSKHRLHDQQAFMWMMFAIGALVVAFSLPSLNRLAVAIGVSYMPSLIFLIAFFVVLSLLMYHTISFSRQQSKLIDLVQEVAYLSKEIEDLKNSQHLHQENASSGQMVESFKNGQFDIIEKSMSGEQHNEHS